MRVGIGARVLVTGASRGIGRAIAHAFAARGCAVGLVARSADELERVLAELPGSGHTAIVADVSDRESIAAAVADFGDCDVLVANAGIARYGPFIELSAAEAEQMTRVNFLGTLYTVRAALPRMLERGRGHIVVTSSGAGFRAFPEAAVYGATKAAQRGFAEALWHELDGTGISTTIVYPGEVESSLHDHERERMPAWYRGKPAPAEPLAEAVVTAVERERRAVHYPRIVQLLRVVHNISPGLGDLMLRSMRGRSAAPRRR